MDPTAIFNEVAQDISAALMRQTALIDGAAGSERAVRAAILVAALRAYAHVIEEQTISEAEHGKVEAFTAQTITALRGALKAANDPKNEPKR